MSILTNTTASLEQTQLAVYILDKQVSKDSRIAARFNPSRQMIRKLDLGRFMSSSDVNARECNAAMNICYSLLIRKEGQGGNLDYYDFTTDERAISRLRRKEMTQ